ncbi:restriction endonuclease subunit S [Domibacillus indicus]|uniref:restriction endonuclease subunit S n=1 Tax=Domibacillus indicus TaxID=1437523 RepID=UPI0006966E08|nr:restriction endonuclease subunit S [Domibacillus indicus]
MKTEFKEGYKEQTEMDSIPSKWETKTVGELFTFQGGQQPPRKYFSSEKKEGYIRLIQIRDYKTDKYLTYIPKEMAKRFCDETDIMIGRYGPPVFQILRGLAGSYNVALIKAIPNEKKLLKEYAYYFLCKEELFKLIDHLSQRSSGQTGVDMDALKNYPLPLPPLEEQQRIAEILSTTDEQIDNTEQLIQKTKELKKGLMQQLLTKGIGHTEFKQSELGEIPELWNVYTLRDLIRIRGGASPSKMGVLSSIGKYPFYKVNDLNFTKKYLNKSIFNFENLSFEEIKENSIIFPKRGASIFTNKIALVSRSGYMDTNLMALEINNSSNLYHEYLFYLLSFRGLVEFADTSSVPQINNKHIELIRLAIPPLREQQKIADILSTIDEQIETYEQEKEKQIELKKGLMQQLLTGKVRVTV